MTKTDDAAFLATVRRSLAEVEVEAPGAVLERVNTSRARGERLILPTGDQVLSTLRWVRPALIAAVLLAAVAGALTINRTPSGASGSEDLFVSRGAFIPSAFAQDVPIGMRPDSRPLGRIVGTRLAAGRYEFAQRWTDSSGLQVTDSRSVVEVAPAILDGTPAWRAVSTWTGNVDAYGVRLEVESVFVARDDLRLLRRDVHASPYGRYSRINIAQRFRADSVLGRMTAEQNSKVTASRPIAQQLPAAFVPFTTEPLAALMLAGATLGPQWRHSVSLIGWAVRPTDLYNSVDMRVVGEEVVAVPAGRFDCWKLELRVAGYRIDYWVRKSDGVGVLTRDHRRRATRGTREILLVRDRS